MKKVLTLSILAITPLIVNAQAAAPSMWDDGTYLRLIFFACLIVVIARLVISKYRANMKVNLILISITFILFFMGYNVKEYLNPFFTDKQELNSGINCKDNADYERGYKLGEMAKMMGEHYDPKEFVEKTNYEIGRNIYKATPCFVEGFNDGQNGRKNQYE